MKLRFEMARTTRSCYVFTHGAADTGNLMSLYLKRRVIEEARIDPHKGVIVTVEEAMDDALPPQP